MSIIGKMEGMRLPYQEVVGWAVEALKRANYSGIDDGMHPEDWAAALVPAIEAVALGYGEGYRNGLRDGRATSECAKCNDDRRKGYE